LTIIIITNVLLWNLRTMSDRYQESKYVTMATIFACEIFLIGVPILIAVDDSSEARYIVLCAFIAFSDMGIMLMIFVPKILFQQARLPDGTSVGTTLFKSKSIRVSGLDESGRSSAFMVRRENKEVIQKHTCLACIKVLASAPNGMAEEKSASIDDAGRVIEA
jgi:hypothetical protein